MYYLIVILVFLMLFSLVTLIIICKKLSEQNNIKKKRIELLSENELLKKDPTLSRSISELYIKSNSHYFVYCIGHFSGILLNTYSIILSVSSLSMLSLSDYSDEITKCISLLSTFFIITLVFSRLDERSSYHLLVWKKCENSIVNISHLTSECDDVNSIKNKIYSCIASCNTETTLPDKLYLAYLSEHGQPEDNNDNKFFE